MSEEKQQCDYYSNPATNPERCLFDAVCVVELRQIDSRMRLCYEHKQFAIRQMLKFDPKHMVRTFPLESVSIEDRQAIEREHERILRERQEKGTRA